MAPALEKERTMAGESIKLVANNKKAYHDYFIEEKYECGISLAGTEVKSIRQGKVSVKEAYVEIEGGEAWIEGMNISPYATGTSSTGIRCARGSSSCTRQRSESSRRPYSRMAIPSFRSRSTLSAAR